MVRTVWVSSTQHTRTMEQYNSVSWFKLCIIRQSALTGISGNMKVKNQTWLLVLEQVGIAVNAAFTQNYFTPSELLLEDLKFDIVYDNKMSLQSSSIVVSMAFLSHFTPNWVILPQIYISSSIAGMHFLQNFAWVSYNNK